MAGSRAPLGPSALALALALALGCSNGPAPGTMGTPADAATDLPTLDGAPDASPDVPPAPPPDAGPAPRSGSNIRHVVVIEQENHTFDNYFGSYCTAPAGSNPSCTAGPSCCEAAPAREPSGVPPGDLTDAANGSYSPDHSQACEQAEIHGGAMDRFVAGAPCSDPRNFAVAPASLMATYHGYARR